MATDSAISVFVRVRPLLATEDSGILPGLARGSTSPDEAPVVAFESSSSIGGFTGVLGEESSNRAVFEGSLAPRITTVLRGGTASLFCYGYTGSGKTHTVVGYGKEPGIYYLAAEHLLSHLQESGHRDLFLWATACEVYGEQVLDLLGPDKLECSLRVDEDGQLQVQGPATSTELLGMESGLLDDPDGVIPKTMSHATLITHSQGLRGIRVHEPGDLAEIGKTCVQQRATGTSTVHHQSSRSHAILQIEVVSEAVLLARHALDKAQAAIPARKNAMDNMSWGAFFSLLELQHEGEVQLLVDGELFWQTFGKVWADPEPEKTWTIHDQGLRGGEKLFTLCGKEDSPLLLIKEQAEQLNAPRLVRRYADQPAVWEAKCQKIKAQFEFVEAQLKKAEAEVTNAQRVLKETLDAGPEAIGGSLVLVDLAGADYDHRLGTEQNKAVKESAAINKSLLALKECFRSLAHVSGQRPKFRDSKLTRLLEDALAPSKSSRRRNRESVSVMVVNVSPAADLERMTLNTLRYGQMYAGGVSTNGTKVNRPAGKGQARSSSGSRPAGKGQARSSKAAVIQKGATSEGRGQQKECDPELRAELFRLYQEHCPEKSKDEVDEILAKFAGRESKLLEMARNKYVKG